MGSGIVIDKNTGQPKYKDSGKSLNPYGGGSSSSSSASSGSNPNNSIVSSKGNRNASVYDGSKTTGNANGYGRGNTYGNRETAYEFVNPKTGETKTIYSNYTNYEDAAKNANLNGWNLRSSATYGTAGSRGNGATFGADGYTSKEGDSGGFSKEALKELEAVKNLYGQTAQNAQTQSTLQNVLNGNGYSNLNSQTNQSGYNIPNFVSYDYSQEYKDMANELAQARKAQLAALTKQYQTQAQRAAEDYDNQGKNAYVNYLVSQKQLPRVMASQGLGGGATEGSYLRLLNNYNQSAANIAQERQKAITDYDLKALAAQAEADSDIAGYNAQYGQLAIQARQQAAEALNNYNQWKAEFEQSNNQFEREMAYKNAMLEYEKAQDLINYAYQAQDYSKYGELTGTDVSNLKAYQDLERRSQEAQLQSQLASLRGSSSRGSSSGSSSSLYNIGGKAMSLSQVRSIANDGLEQGLDGSGSSQADEAIRAIYGSTFTTKGNSEQTPVGTGDDVFVKGLGFINDNNSPKGLQTLLKNGKVIANEDRYGNLYYTSR